MKNVTSRQILIASGILIAIIGVVVIIDKVSKDRRDSEKPLFPTITNSKEDYLGTKDECGKEVTDHDASWKYKKCGHIWFTTKKGTDDWTSLAKNQKAIDKLEAHIA